MAEVLRPHRFCRTTQQWSIRTPKNQGGFQYAVVLTTLPDLAPATVADAYDSRAMIEVDNLYGKQHLGLVDFRVQAYEATEKWFAVVCLALVFLQWRLNHAHAKASGHTLADVVRHHRYEHARTLLETACQEAANLRDALPVLKRFLYAPT